MAIPVSSRGNFRYLGNTNQNPKEVHDLQKETTQCQINEIIKAGHAVRFNPDTLQQAHSEGFDNCYWCIGGSKG